MKIFNLNEKMKVFLDDFDKFTEYIACNKVTVGKTNKFISPKFLFEINEILKIKQEDIKPKSTQLAYPLIHLFNNLSVRGKLFSEELIKGGKIILKPTDRLSLFKNLNDIEKYISLIEILWMDCNFEKLGYQTYDYISVYSAMKILEDISSSKSEKVLVVDNRISNYTTMILYFSYFGLIEVEENKEEKREKHERFFCPSSIIINPIGLEIFKILNKKRELEEWNIPYRREIGEWKIEFNEKFHTAFKKLFKSGELENSLPRNSGRFKDGIYTFKVYIDRNIWAKIKLDGMHTLHDLHNCIQGAFDFDNDHMYSFFMDGIAWSDDKFTCPFEDEGPHADEVKIGELDLSEKQNFMYLFDYGDEWQFKVEVYSIEEMNEKVISSEIVEIKGKVPKQYPNFDDEGDFDDQE